MTFGKRVIVIRRDNPDSKHAGARDIVHPLTPSHFRLARPQKADGTGVSIFPVQADISSSQTRLLYLDSKESQSQCLQLALNAQGFTDQLDQYEILRKLGDGGSGQVFLVSHRSTDETFALKKIEAKIQSKKHAEQIAREIQLQYRCRNCPNIVRFKEEFTRKNDHFIVMEHMAGGDL